MYDRAVVSMHDKLKFTGIHCAVERWNALHASVVIERRTYGRKSELSKPHRGSYRELLTEGGFIHSAI